MVSYRYLGSALTNANGVATFDYQGTGAGEIDVIASLDKPIVDGSIVSEIFPVFDYFLYDSGVTGTKNPNVTVGTNVIERVTSNGTVLTCTNGTSLATAQYTYTKVIGGDFEAYVTLTTPSSILMGFYGSSDSARISISNVENRTYKFKRTGSNWIVQYYNGSEWVDLSFYNNTLGNKDCRFYLYLYSDNETDTITFKDVKVTVEDSLNIGGDSIVQTGDTIGITGKFYESGIPVKNIDLDIYKNGVKVDTVNTGSTGVASYTYTGTGVGEVDFQFKYGYFVSETYGVIDAMFYDTGTTGTPNAEWWNSNQSNLQLTSDDTGLTASNSTTSNLYLAPNKLGTSKSSMSDLIEWNDFICEFTFHEINNTNQPLTLETRDSNNHVNQRNLSTIGLTDGDVVKLEYTNDIAKIYKNDVQVGSNYSNCTGNVMIRFGINNNFIRFSTFKVYPI